MSARFVGFRGVVHHVCGVCLLAVAACSSDPAAKSDKDNALSTLDAGGSADTAGNKTGAGGSGFSVNPTICSSTGGYRSAIVVMGGASPAPPQAYAKALGAEGYTVVYRAPAKAGDDASEDASSEPSDGGDATGFGGGPLDEVVSGDGTSELGDGASADDATADDATAGDAAAGAGDAVASDASSDAPAGDAGPALPPVPTVYTAGADALGDVVVLLEDGSLWVASACELDAFAQVRRLDFALAEASRVLAQVTGEDYKVETARWARPTAWYGAKAGTFRRQYLGDGVPFNKSLTGTIAMAASPDDVAFGLYGHADTPSQVGDVVGVDTLVVGGTKIAGAEKVTVTGRAALAWGLVPHVGKGETPWTVNVFIADASLDWSVGVYFPFVDALFPAGAQGSLAVSLQGSLPGQTRVSKAIADIALPAAPKH